MYVQRVLKWISRKICQPERHIERYTYKHPLLRRGGESLHKSCDDVLFSVQFSGRVNRLAWPSCHPGIPKHVLEYALLKGRFQESYTLSSMDKDIFFLESQFMGNCRLPVNRFSLQADDTLTRLSHQQFNLQQDTDCSRQIEILNV